MFQEGYYIEAGACTQCGLCTAVCPSNAIGVDSEGYYIVSEAQRDNDGRGWW